MGHVSDHMNTIVAACINAETGVGQIFIRSLKRARCHAISQKLHGTSPIKRYKKKC